jgi:hypothetical protein
MLALVVTDLGTYVTLIESLLYILPMLHFLKFMKHSLTILHALLNLYENA